MKGHLEVIFSIRKSVNYGFIMKHIRNLAVCKEVNAIKWLSVYILIHRREKMMKNNKI